MVVWFWTSFVTTLALVAGTVWTGKLARRVPHLVLALSSVAMLTVTVLLTEALLRAVAFPEREMSIHLFFAKTAAALVLPVAITGIMTWKRIRFRKLHLICVASFLLMTVIATGTGIWVYSLATPR